MGDTRRNFIRLAGLGGGLCMSAAVAHGSSAPNSGADFLTLFSQRCSVRRYKPDPVPEEHLRLILDAARRPPTSGNQQPWKFLVIRDRTKIERMRSRCVELAEPRWHDLATEERASRKEAFAKRMAGYFSAPVYVVVLTDSQSTYPSYNQHDGPLAAGYLCLAARALGYGTVYVTDAIPEQVTREVLSIPERYVRVCITPLGVPDGWPEPTPKKKLEEFIVNESFG